MLYEMEAAYKPTVSGDLDTQNFEKFPEVSAKIKSEFFFHHSSIFIESMVNGIS